VDGPKRGKEGGSLFSALSAVSAGRLGQSEWPQETQSRSAKTDGPKKGKEVKKWESEFSPCFLFFG
jgi:hypothetical protein